MDKPIKYIDLSDDQYDNDPSLLEDIINGTLDAVVVRNVFPNKVISNFIDRLQNADSADRWNRPNISILGIDLQLLGVGAAPTACTPYGPENSDYFDAVEKTERSISELFGTEFDPCAAIEATLGKISGKPVQVPSTQDGRNYSACTVRVIPEGQSLMLHHDNHFALNIYQDLLPQLDTSLQLSFFVMLQRPAGGGRICVYPVGPEQDSDLPRLDNGMLDPITFDEQLPHQLFELETGDMFVFGSGRLYHKIEPVIGSQSRVTIGGFLALDVAHEHCMYWS